MPSTVKFKGEDKRLAGTDVKVGSKAPEFKCLNNSLAIVTFADTPAKARLFSIVPSLDTPVCSLQSKKFNEALSAFGDNVAAYTFSFDLPFAQKRFCSVEGVANLTTLSDVHDQSFAQNWGVLIEGLPLKLMARSVFVVDKNGTVIYAEYVPEVTSEPNYAAAIEALKKIT